MDQDAAKRAGRVYLWMAIVFGAGAYLVWHFTTVRNPSSTTYPLAIGWLLAGGVYVFARNRPPSQRRLFDIAGIAILAISLLLTGLRWMNT